MRHSKKAIPKICFPLNSVIFKESAIKIIPVKH